MKKYTYPKIKFPLESLKLLAWVVVLQLKLKVKKFEILNPWFVSKQRSECKIDNFSKFTQILTYQWLNICYCLTKTTETSAILHEKYCDDQNKTNNLNCFI